MLREQIKNKHYISSCIDINYITNDKFTYEDIIESITYKSTKDKLNTFFNRLSYQERYTLYEIYYEDKTENQIANELHITRSSVHRRKVSALKKLKKMFIEPNQSRI